MTFYELAKRIANFVWENADWYELRDTYDTYGELLSDTLQSLIIKKKRIALINWLYEVTEEREEAEILIREVRSL